MGLGITFLFSLLFLFRVTFPQSRFASDIFCESVHHNASNHHSSDYAYAWVLDEINGDKPGFVWKFFTSANFLRREGSESDFWVFARLSPNSTLEELPDEVNRMFRALNVNVILLDKTKEQSFTQLVYDKFLTINMADYKRVMFLEGNMMPRTNLDYIFHLSDPDDQDTPTLLKPNLIMATRADPCNIGMIMVEPLQENLQQYLDIVRRSAKTLSHPHFHSDERRGIFFKEMGDLCESVNIRNRKQSRWRTSHSDQGLMYIYAIYILGDVSIAIGDRIQNFRRGPKENLPIKESDVRELFIPFQGNLLRHQHSCDDTDKRIENRVWQCNPPYDTTAQF